MKKDCIYLSEKNALEYIELRYLRNYTRNFKWPSIKIWQCPIHNSKLCLIKYELYINVYNFENKLF